MSKTNTFISKKCKLVYYGVKDVIFHHFIFTFTLSLIRFSVASFVSNFMGVYNQRLQYLGYTGKIFIFITPSRYLITGGVSIAFGHMSEWSKLGRIYILTLGVLIIGVGNLVYAFVTNFYFIIAGILIFGVGVGAVYTEIYAVAADYFPEHLYAYGLFVTEFIDAIAWIVAPYVFNTYIESGRNDYMTPMVIFGSIQVVAAILGFFVMRYKVKDNMIEEVKTYTENNLSLWAKLRIICTTRICILVCIVLVVGGAMFYSHISAFAIFYPNTPRKKFLMADFMGPISVILSMFLEAFEFKEYYIVYGSFFLSILVLISGDKPVDKSKMSENGQFALLLVIIYLRNIIYYSMYLFGNILFMIGIGYCYREKELNGLAGAFYTLILSVGNFSGVLITNTITYGGLKLYHVTIILSAMLMCSFICALLIFYVKRKKKRKVIIIINE